jgi:hypothetical protein
MQCLMRQVKIWILGSRPPAAVPVRASVRASTRARACEKQNKAEYRYSTCKVARRDAVGIRPAASVFHLYLGVFKLLTPSRADSTRRAPDCWHSIAGHPTEYCRHLTRTLGTSLSVSHSQQDRNRCGIGRNRRDSRPLTTHTQRQARRLIHTYIICICIYKATRHIHDRLCTLHGETAPHLAA